MNNEFIHPRGLRDRARLARRAGAVLVTAAVALLAGACSTEPAPPFTVDGTGNLSGIVFLDRDQNGIFDPSAGDSALSNLHLLVRSRGTTLTLPNGDVRTDAAGRFSITGLPAGTQSLQIDTTGVGSEISFCVNPVPVSIYINETQFVKVDARSGCVVTISVASAQPQGSHITVRGTVTSTLNQISTGQAYIEDATGGLQLFSPAGPSFQIGDIVEVTGTLSSFSNELELANGTVNSVTPGTPLNPVDITAAAALAAGGDIQANLQGRLVRIKAAKLTDNFTGGGGRNGIINDGTGALTVRIDSHVVGDAATIPSTFTAGKCYNWTGILKAFTSPAIELFPRTLNDVVEVSCP
jgi:hypothetical protein